MDSIARRSGWVSARMTPAHALLAVALLAWVLALLLRSGPADQAVFLFINARAVEHVHWVSCMAVVGLGSAAWIVSASFGPARRDFTAAVLLVVLCGGAVVHVLKVVVGAPRPLALLGSDVVNVVGIALYARAFPSGHSAMLFALVALASCWPGRGTRAGLFAFASLAAAGALSRVVAGAHWPSDVLAGAAIGLAAGALLVGTSTGWRLVQATAGLLGSKSGSRVTAAFLVIVAGSLWVSPTDYPLARGLHSALPPLALLAAWRWWTYHQGQFSWARVALFQQRTGAERP